MSTPTDSRTHTAHVGVFFFFLIFFRLENFIRSSSQPAPTVAHDESHVREAELARARGTGAWPGARPRVSRSAAVVSITRAQSLTWTQEDHHHPASPQLLGPEGVAA